MVMGEDGERGKDWLRARGHHLCLTDTILWFFVVFCCCCFFSSPEALLLFQNFLAEILEIWHVA